MKAKPYIGITGFKTVREVTAVAELFTEALQGFEEHYTAMFGFLTSTQSLVDYTKGGERCPPVQELQDLVRAVPDNFFPVIHHYTTEPDKLHSEVCQLRLQIGRGWGLQINSVWPKVDEVKRIRTEYDLSEVILQIPKEALESGPHLAWDRNLRMYAGLVDHVLIDPSGGLSIEFDVDKCVSLMKTASENLPDATIGVAGGLDGDNVRRKFGQVARDLKKPFSIDAEGRLRAEETFEGGSLLASERVKAYVEGAAEALKISFDEGYLK